MSEQTEPKFNLNRYIRWSFFSVLAGLMAGAAATLFLVLLKLATDYREGHEVIIWALPAVGLFIGWTYHRWGQSVAGGNNLILDEIHDPQKTVPVRMTPFILIGTVLTHLFGGSAGREGTAVQMGASLADQLQNFFTIEPEERKILLTAGAGAGFGAACGVPWAGVIFGMEVIVVGRLRPFAWMECLIASFVGYYTTRLLGAPHTHYPQFEIPEFSLALLGWVALAGICFGLAARTFSAITHLVERFNKKFVSYPPLRPFLAGLLLIGLYYLEGSYRYDGLGLQFIQDAIEEQGTFRDPALKILFTAITVGSGFKGGEFIPLVFTGTTLGSALGGVMPVSFQLLAGLGFAAVFGAAANTPLACAVMCMEIFGISVAPYALVACYMGYYFSGHSGIYKSQKYHAKKHERVLQLFSVLGELPRRFFATEDTERTEKEKTE